MFGLFNDEGCVEDDFCTFERAQVALANYSAELIVSSTSNP